MSKNILSNSKLYLTQSGAHYVTYFVYGRMELRYHVLGRVDWYPAGAATAVQQASQYKTYLSDH